MEWSVSWRSAIWCQGAGIGPAERKEARMSRVYVGRCKLLEQSKDVDCVDRQELLARATLPETVVLVCDALDAECDLAQLTDELRARKSDVQVQLTTSAALEARLARPEKRWQLSDKQSMVPARDNRDQPTLAWYRELQEFVLATRQPKKPMVLWGPPGVGKTLALERHVRILTRQAGAKASQLTGGSEARALLLSCANPDAQQLIDQVNAFGRTASQRSLLAVDDFEVLQTKEMRERLVAAVLAVRCRVVVVCLDLYADSCRPLRKVEAKLTKVRVGRAHLGRLASHLEAMFGLTTADARACAEQSNGDVRQAQLHARLALFTVDKEHKVQQAPHYSLLRCAKSDQLGSDLRSAHWDRMDDSAELLYVNAPRYLARTGYNRDEDALNGLATLAEMQDLASLTDCYERVQRESGFETADGVVGDKELKYELALERPLRLLAPHVAQQRGRLPLPPRMEFTARTANRASQQRAEQLRAERVRSTVVGREGLTAAARTLALADGRSIKDTDHGVRRRNHGHLLDGTVEMMRHGAVLPNAELLTKELAAKKPSKRLSAIVGQFAAAGGTAVDFASACLCALKLDDYDDVRKLPSESSVRKLFQRAKPALAYDDSVLGSRIKEKDVTKPPPPAKRRAAASGAPNKRRRRGAAVQAGSMLQYMKK